MEAAAARDVSGLSHPGVHLPPVLGARIRRLAAIHGDADTLVPIAHSERMRAALTAAGTTVDFVTIPGGDHGFTNPTHSQRAMELTVAWFERHLGRK